MLDGSNDKVNNNDFYSALCTNGVSLIHNHSSGNHYSGNVGEDIKGACNNDGGIWKVAFLIHNNYNSHCLKGISLIHNHSSGNHSSGNIGEDILGSL